MQSKTHWEGIYASKAVNTVSWFQEHSGVSLQLIDQAGLAGSARIIDVGGGASTLVDDLLAKGFVNISVLDLAESALEAARQRLGTQRAAQVTWICGDITRVQLPESHYDLWHDRAAFHFLIEAADRDAYKAALTRSLKPGGHLILATFAEDGPVQCSGLPIRRYSVTELEQEMGPQFTLLHSGREVHTTPSGMTQLFSYAHFLRAG